MIQLDTGKMQITIYGQVSLLQAHIKQKRDEVE